METLGWHIDFLSISKKTMQAEEAARSTDLQKAASDRIKPQQQSLSTNLCLSSCFMSAFNVRIFYKEGLLPQEGIVAY